MHLSEHEIRRREEKKELEKLSINPYPSQTFDVNITSTEITLNPTAFKKDQEVSIAGRIMSRRIMGSASFIELQDQVGKIQVYLRRDDLCPNDDKTLYNIVFKKLMDIGDIIGIKGYVFTTQTGEISIYAQQIILLSKSLRPIPIVKEAQKENDVKVYDAFKDPEQRYRQRYVDLIVNPKTKETFIKRTKLINVVRSFLNKKDYLEVETPILQPIYGGALAKPFVTHHHSLDTKLYLRIANELYLKRLIVGGFEGVYEFAKDFRNEGMSRFHNPEFTQVELYVAYKDYEWMMNLVEEMIEKVAIEVTGSTKVKVGDNVIDFKRSWKRFTMFDAIEHFTKINISEMNVTELTKTAQKLNIELDATMGKGKIIDEIFGAYCEPHLIQPTFITDYPIEMSPLAKKHRNKHGLTERFEVICNGKEICNAFSELNDPLDQRERFDAQLELKTRGDQESMMLDEDFLRALEYGMPPTAGLGIGIDRLAMIMTNSNSIQDVILFPQMRPEKKKNNFKDFENLGIPKEWIDVILKIGIESTKELKEIKPTQLHQKLNGYRKKTKINIPAIQLEEVTLWLK